MNYKLLRRLSLIFMLVVVMVGLSLYQPTSTQAQSGYSLVWSDDFNGSTGSAPNSATWGYDIGDGCPSNCGWGNTELEYYTDSTKNAFITDDPGATDGKALDIRAIKETNGKTCNGKPCNYTSARLLTANKFTVKYGRIELRAKLPYGQGLWPAFWMMGQDYYPNEDWPQCGEIDIMENLGSEPSINHGTIHGPGYSDDKGPTAAYTLPGGQQFKDAYHTFSIEWTVGQIKWYVDGNLYETRTTKDAGTNKWVFDHPFFMLLNVAVGGDWGGNPNSTTVFPQDLRVDYIHIYQQTGATATNTSTFVPPTNTPIATTTLSKTPTNTPTVTSTTAASTTINDTAAGITYAGASWGHSSSRGLGDYQNDVHYSATSGAYFQYTFTGSRIDYITEKNSDEGNIDISIDGIFQQTVSAYNVTRLAQQTVYSKTGLSAGSHTIKGVKTSGKYILVDAFKVYP